VASATMYWCSWSIREMNERSQFRRKAASCAKAVSVGSCFRGVVLGGNSIDGVSGTALDRQVLSDVTESVGLLQTAEEAGWLC
jgi:hypothetical protein